MNFNEVLFEITFKKTLLRQNVKRAEKMLARLHSSKLNVERVWEKKDLGLFRVNPHSIVAWMSRNPFLEAGAKSEGEVTANI